MNIEPIQFDTKVETILISLHLLVSDLQEADHLQLFGIHLDRHLIGIVGVEIYETVGLLRSLAVIDTYRNCGYGQALVTHAETWALQRGVKTLYLLTTTATNFFRRLNYEPVPRSEAPTSIAGTTQFAGLCPGSSIFMRKIIGC